MEACSLPPVQFVGSVLCWHIDVIISLSLPRMLCLFSRAAFRVSQRMILAGEVVAINMDHTSPESCPGCCLQMQHSKAVFHDKTLSLSLSLSFSLSLSRSPIHLVLESTHFIRINFRGITKAHFRENFDQNGQRSHFLML